MNISWIEAVKTAIGDDSFRQLCEVLPGRRIYIPNTCTPNHYLSGAIGIEKANALCNACAGMEILIPISAAKIAMIKGDIQSGLSTPSIALKYFVTRRHVEKLKRQMRNDVVEKLQMRLI